MDSVAGHDRGALLATLPALPLTPAEFLALADALGERPPAPVTAELADLTRRQREQAVDEAVRSLFARGVLTAGDPVRIALAAARLVQITCRPALRTELRWGKPGEPDQVVRIASVTDASVAAVPQDGAVRYLPFATEQLLGFLEEAAGLAEGGDGSWGLVSVVYRDGAGRRAGGEVAWVDVGGTLYEVPAARVPPSPDQASPDEDSASDEDGDRTPVLGEPTTRAQLVAAVAELLPGTVADRESTDDSNTAVNV
jgi:hypothetical protein